MGAPIGHEIEMEAPQGGAQRKSRHRPIPELSCSVSLGTHYLGYYPLLWARRVCVMRAVSCVMCTRTLSGHVAMSARWVVFSFGIKVHCPGSYCPHSAVFDAL